MNDLMGSFGQNGWMVEVFAILSFTAVIRFVAKLILDRLAAKSLGTANVSDDALIEAARRPVVYSIWILVFLLLPMLLGERRKLRFFPMWLSLETRV